MNTLPYKIGSEGIYIPMIGENDLFVPWCVVKRTEEAMAEARKRIDTLPFGLRQIVKKLANKIPSQLSAINTIIETTCMVKQMGGRVVWKELEYELVQDKSKQCPDSGSDGE